ncbi:MAG: MAPEG family protein [Aquabacterium sp.]|uniref:MAPEG family protein n=1 Tax=Aquabacterium sp. TaxID=1872578 RepID=UPI0025C283F7|nr:MAPEG family protein [Aquabacterium sp.]MBI5927007.1 MAPEG family protein [Aquabacterium sp.]
MTTDLWMLTYTALLCLGIPFLYGSGRFLQPGGFQWSAGNRDKDLAVPDWTTRAVRAHLNLLESLAPFAIVVLVAHVAGKANATTALGATIFFWGRVAHLIAYTAGIVYLRTLVWFAAWCGGVMIITQLFH